MAPQEAVEKFEFYGMFFIYLFFIFIMIIFSSAVDLSAWVSLSHDFPV